jgi:hypothetical protein
VKERLTQPKTKEHKMRSSNKIEHFCTYIQYKHITTT